MSETPMTKKDAQSFIRRAREALRDAERDIRDGRGVDLVELMNEVTGSASAIQEAAETQGIRGVEDTGELDPWH